MSNDNNAENLELQKVLASLAYTQKEFRKTSKLIEEFKEVLDPETGQSIKILEIKVREDRERGERGETCLKCKSEIGLQVLM